MTTNAARPNGLKLPLSEGETRFRTMADHAPVLLWMARADGLCEFFNQGWLTFTGRSLSEELGVGWAEGIHPEDVQRCMHTYFEALVARRPFAMEYRLRRHDGTYRWICARLPGPIIRLRCAATWWRRSGGRSGSWRPCWRAGHALSSS